MERIGMVFAGFLAGMGVSAGTFAFVIVIGIIPRIIRKTKMENVLLTENMVILGAVVGNMLSLWEGPIWNVAGIWGHIIIAVYGICTGIFVGCISVALAEIMHTFPVIFRRFGLKKGLSLVVFAMAFGKLIGSLFYFVFGFTSTA